MAQVRLNGPLDCPDGIWCPACELYPGYYRAVCGELPMLGIIDGLCWNHVAGINPTTADVPQLDTRTRLPPGLMKGKR